MTRFLSFLVRGNIYTARGGANSRRRAFCLCQNSSMSSWQKSCGGGVVVFSLGVAVSKSRFSGRERQGDVDRKIEAKSGRTWRLLASANQRKRWDA